MTDYDALPLADVLREHIGGDQVAQLTVSSNSMSPLLKSGDVIGLQYTGFSHIQRGQIVTFTDSGESRSLTTHRIAASWIDGQGNLQILTRGDHVLFFDRPRKVEAIVGQVVWRVRNGRKLRLDQGPGEWLCKQLGLIAERERVQISGLSLDQLQLTPDGIASANHKALLRRKGITARLVSRASRSWRRLLAFIVPLFAREKKSPRGEGN